LKTEGSVLFWVSSPVIRFIPIEKSGCSLLPGLFYKGEVLLANDLKTKASLIFWAIPFWSIRKITPYVNGKKVGIFKTDIFGNKFFVPEH